MKKIEWIDSLKGIGIILVVLGHAAISPHLFGYIFSFHMPLFFFISGYLFSYERNPHFLKFVKSKARGLLIPYLTFALMGLGIWLAYSYLGAATSEISILSAIKEILVSKRNFIFFNVPIWYLTSLFTMVLFFYLLRKYIRNDFVLIGVLLVIGSIGFIQFQTAASLHTLPWSFDATMFYMVFYGAGNLIKNHKDKIRLKTPVYLTALTINLLFLVIPGLFNVFYAQRIPYGHSVYVYFVAMFIAFCGILGYIYLSKKLTIKSLKYLGKNSLVILGLHVPLAFYVVDKLFYILGVEIAPGLRGIVQTVLSLIILLPVIEIMNRYFPYLLGKKKKRKNQPTVEAA